jgi:hypothetical protein
VKWWLLRASDDLTPEQQTYRDRLLTAVPALPTAQRLAQEFGRLLRKRDRAAFAPRGG